MNNYVCVGEDCNKNNLYRIIGSFINEGGEYELKLIKETAGKEELGTSGAYSVEYYGYYWNSTNGLYNDEPIGNKNINKWADSNLNTNNLNVYYYGTYLNNNPDLKNMIVDHKWIVGGGSYDNLEYSDAKKAYNYEVGDNKTKVGDVVCYDDPSWNAEPISCTKEDIEYTEGKIGLMYLSDYYYAALSNSWQTQLSRYNFAEEENWLYNGMTEWLIARPFGSPEDAFYVGLNGFVGSNLVDDSVNAYGARPVFYLSSSVKLSKGEGSKTDPYVLEGTGLVGSHDPINLTVSDE